jgi:uncharacterized membrane protein YgcG
MREAEKDAAIAELRASALALAATQQAALKERKEQRAASAAAEERREQEQRALAAQQVRWHSRTHRAALSMRALQSTMCPWSAVCTAHAQCIVQSSWQACARRSVLRRNPLRRASTRCPTHALPHGAGGCGSAAASRGGGACGAARGGGASCAGAGARGGGRAGGGSDCPRTCARLARCAHRHDPR